MKKSACPENGIHPYILRVTTVPQSLTGFCTGLLSQLGKEGYRVAVASSPGEDLQKISQSDNVPFFEVPMERRIAPFKDLKSLWRMYKLLRRERPDIVHSMTPKAGLLTMMAGKLAGVPVRIHTFTGLIWPTSHGIMRKILMTTDRILCACATHIVPEGQGVARDLVQGKITRKPLKVLGYGNVRGIDTEHYSVNAPGVAQEIASLRKDGVFTFIFIGRLVGDKGITPLVTAFTQIHKKHPDTRLILVGEREDALDPLPLKTLETIDNCQAIEAVGRKNDVRPWLGASDVFVFPSYREGFPNVVIEACSMGLPCVVTDINGSREIINDGEQGLVVPPRNAQALAQAMERMITDRNLQERAKKQVRQHVEERWHSRIVWNALFDFYKEVLKSKK